MDWKQEIFRCVFVAFGAFEVLANASYLIMNNGIEKAYKQHGEIPKTASRKQMKIKVICMLTAGCLFFVCGSSSFITRSFNNTAYLIVLILFALYAAIEGQYYKFWKTRGFSIATIVLLLWFLI